MQIHILSKERPLLPRKEESISNAASNSEYPAGNIGAMDVIEQNFGSVLIMADACR